MTDASRPTTSADVTDVTRDAPTAARRVARQVLETEARAVSGAIAELDEGFDRAVELIRGLRGSVIVSGTGKSGLVGQKISATLASTGSSSHFLHPTDAMHGDLGRIRGDDLVLLLSYGGQTEEVLALAALLRQDRVPVISMTGRRDSHLARISDAHLCIGDVTEADPHALAPTASTTAMLALGDALALAVAAARSFTAEDFHKRHPGGLLGRQMMPVVEVLRFRVDDNLPLVGDDQPVDRVLAASAGTGQARRAGAVLLVDAEGRLSGIFTDGDLRRLLVNAGPAALKQPIREVMTSHPRCLTDTARVREAVQLSRELRIDEIPVIDSEGRPVGLLDVQDLIALKVIEG